MLNLEKFFKKLAQAETNVQFQSILSTAYRHIKSKKAWPKTLNDDTPWSTPAINLDTLLKVNQIMQRNIYKAVSNIVVLNPKGLACSLSKEGIASFFVLPKDYQSEKLVVNNKELFLKLGCDESKLREDAQVEFRDFFMSIEGGNFAPFTQVDKAQCIVILLKMGII